jgi:hypothetical protein
VSIAEQVVDEYLKPGAKSRAAVLDAAYRLQMEMLRTLVIHLEDDLHAEGIPADTAERVIRRLVYGSPLPDEEALTRIREREEAVKALMLAAPATADITGLLGMPPR